MGIIAFKYILLCSSPLSKQSAFFGDFEARDINEIQCNFMFIKGQLFENWKIT